MSESSVSYPEPVAEAAAASPEQAERAARYAKALGFFRARRFANACAIWDAVAREEAESAEPGNRKGEPVASPAARMAERAGALATNPPPADWDGVFNLTSK